ncbi:MAG: hydroxyacid dehydrogenase, partial [Acidimicrobiales bacterium]
MSSDLGIVDARAHLGARQTVVHMARRPHALYVLDERAQTLVYGPEQRAAIGELVEVASGPVTATELAGRLELLADVEILLSGWGAPVMDAAFLDSAPRLEAVFYGAGAVRGFVTDAFFARGIRLSSANAANAAPVAELAFALVVLSLKNVWGFVSCPAGPRDPRRDEVLGAYREVVGLLGLGAIGRLVSERLSTLSVDVLAFDPFCDPAKAAALGVKLVALDELFARSGVVSVHAPLYAQTRGIVTGGLVGSMRRGATLLNTARGGLVRHDELAAVLTVRPDLHAVLDVTEPEPLPPGHELLGLANVVVLPHIAGSLGPECRRLGDTVVAELRRY